MPSAPLSTALGGARRLAWRVTATAPGPVRSLAEGAVRRRGNRELRALEPMPRARRRLYIGPWNTAGQAWEWTRAVREHVPDATAQNLWAQRSADQVHFRFPAEHRLSLLAQRGDVRRIHGERVLREATHVLFESGRPVLANFHAGSMLDDLPTLDMAGIRSAVLYHGSEIRDLREHAQRYPHSPFRGEWDDYFHTLQTIVERNRADLDDFRGAGDRPVFVSTPDLLDAVPGAVWLPLVVDVDRFASTAPVLERRRPVVLHAPTNVRLKGGATVRRQMEALATRGAIEYYPIERISATAMPAKLSQADIVLDQFALGATGAFAAEAMAAGRVVLGHLAAVVRDRMREGDPAGEEPPVVEATPDTVGEVLERVVTERTANQRLASLGPDWARRNHNGARAASALAPFLGVNQP